MRPQEIATRFGTGLVGVLMLAVFGISANAQSDRNTAWCKGHGNPSPDR
jgi:hypothetical protein